MGHSQRLTADSIRNVYRLVREICELGDDPMAWRRHMLAELQKQCGALQTVSLLLPLTLDATRTQQFVEVGHGFDDHAARIYQAYIAAGDFTPNPMTPAIMSRFGSPLTLSRCEAVDDRDWHRSIYFNEVCRGMGADDSIVSLAPIERGACVMVLGVSRELGDGEFGRREHALVKLFHEELAHVIQTPPLGWRDPHADLSPRQRQLITLLGSGKSEKQIAAHLILSRHTVHNYMKALYRKFGASSQTELLAKVRPRADFRPRLM
jgi:DNA-binding CsgD family transcriptional regulator